jgi:antitoxin HigA-1
MTRELPPTHPGEHLAEFMDEYGLTAVALARATHIALPHVEELVNGDRGVTADVAVRLARVFRTTPQFWMNLQAHHDLVLAAEALDAAAERIEPVAAA